MRNRIHVHGRDRSIDDEEVRPRRSDGDQRADHQRRHERSGRLDDQTGDGGRQRAAEIAAEILHGADRGGAVRRRGDRTQRPGAGAGEIDEEQRRRNEGDRQRIAGDVGRGDRAGRRAEQGDRGRILAALDRPDAAAHQKVYDESARDAADDAPSEGNGRRPAGEFHAHVPLDFEIAGQPGGVDPCQIDAAEIAQDHAPGGAEAEQQLPLAQRDLGSLPRRVALRPIAILLRSRVRPRSGCDRRETRSPP